MTPEVAAKVESIDARLTAGGETFADHEARLRALERFEGRVIGALALIAIEIPVAVAVAVALLRR